MPKSLTDTQRVILAEAAAHPSGRVLPTPKSIQKNGGAVAQSLRALLSNGLIAEVPVLSGDVQWGNNTELPTTLVISADGLAAIGITNEGGFHHRQLKEPVASALGFPRSGSKLAILIDCLSAASGATIDELVSATGWQKHSVRGAISGALKVKRKIDIISEVEPGRGRIYRVRTKPIQDQINPIADAGTDQP